MRILVYPHDLNMGGSQTNAIELAAAVSRLGHECIIFGRPGTMCSRIEELGLTFIESPAPQRRPSRRVVKALREVVRKHEIDVIHGYEWPPGLEAAAAAEGLEETAAMCTVMSMAVAPFLPRWLPLVVGTQQISALEQSTGRLNVNLLEPPVDLQYNNRIDFETIRQFKRQWHLDDRPVVVCVSRLVTELKSEGILTAIDVAESLAKSTPFQLVIVGDGKARPSIERAAELTNSRLNARTVILTGELQDPRPAYAAADVALGMGGSALRAMAFAKPLVVQGENGYFRTLTPQSVGGFLWQGWYGRGNGSPFGRKVLEGELSPLLADQQLRRELGIYGREVVSRFSLERAARLQLTLYRDAFSGRAGQKKQLLEAGRTLLGLGGYHIEQRFARVRGRQRADDFNAEPAVVRKRRIADVAAPGSASGPILYFPGVGWETLAGTDRQLAIALSRDTQIVWVDTPYSILRRRDRMTLAVTHPHPNIVRLRASTLAGVQRPLFRYVANWRRAQVARRYLTRHGLTPSAIIASTTAPMLHLTRAVPGVRVYYATDDFVEAANLWGVSKRYLSRAREQNLSAADLVLAVSPALARHLQRGPACPRCLPNGVDLQRFAAVGSVRCALTPLQPPIVGVIGQFNSRTDLSLLEAVSRDGHNLLLIGPRWFRSGEDDKAFDQLVGKPSVHWIDEVPPSELNAYLQAMDVGLTPYADSMFNRRSHPLKTLDYLAAGIPVVTTDIAPPTGLDGRYVSAEGTARQFCDRVRLVTSNSSAPENIRSSLRTHTWESRAAQLLTWLHEEATGRALQVGQNCGANSLAEAREHKNEPGR